jgi:hypothetical protein
MAGCSNDSVAAEPRNLVDVLLARRPKPQIGRDDGPSLNLLETPAGSPVDRAATVAADEDVRAGQTEGSNDGLQD